MLHKILCFFSIHKWEYKQREKKGINAWNSRVFFRRECKYCNKTESLGNRRGYL